MFSPGDEYVLARFVKMHDVYKNVDVETAIGLVKSFLPATYEVDPGHVDSFTQVIGSGAYGLVVQYGTTHALKFVLYDAPPNTLDPNVSHEVIMAEQLDQIAVNNPEIYTHVVPCRVLQTRIAHPPYVNFFKHTYIDVVRMPLAHCTLGEHLRRTLYNNDRFMERRTRIITSLWKGAKALVKLGIYPTDLILANILVVDPENDTCLFADIGGLTMPSLDRTHTCTIASLETSFQDIEYVAHKLFRWRVLSKVFSFRRYGMCPVTPSMVDVQCAFLAASMSGQNVCNYMYKHMTWWPEMDLRMFRESRPGWGLVDYINRLTTCYLMFKKTNWVQINADVLGVFEEHIRRIAKLVDV